MKLPLIVALSLSTTVLSGAPAPAQRSGAELAVPALANEAVSGRLAEDVALTKATISLLQARNFRAIRERLNPAVGEVTDDRFRQMSDTIGSSEPASIETISASETRKVLTGERTSRILLEYGFGSKWVVVDAAVKTMGAEKQFLRLYLTLNSLPLRELNAFHLLGKGTPQYLFLAGWILVVVSTAYATYLAFRRNTGWRQWVLVLLMPLGLTPTVALNWNTAQVFIVESLSYPAGYIPILAVRYPMALFANTETGAVYLYLSAPLIAAAYLIRLRGKRESAGLRTA